MPTPSGKRRLSDPDIFDFPVSPPRVRRKIQASTTSLVKNAKRLPAPIALTAQVSSLPKPKTPLYHLHAPYSPSPQVEVSKSNPSAACFQAVQSTRVTEMYSQANTSHTPVPIKFSKPSQLVKDILELPAGKAKLAYEKTPQRTMVSRGTQTTEEETPLRRITAERETQTTPMQSKSQRRHTVKFTTPPSSAGLVTSLPRKNSLRSELKTLKRLKAEAQQCSLSSIRIIHENSLGEEAVAWEGQLSQWMEGVEMNLHKHDQEYTKFKERWTKVNGEMEKLMALLDTESSEATNGAVGVAEGDQGKVLEIPGTKKGGSRLSTPLKQRLEKSRGSAPPRESESQRSTPICGKLEKSRNSPRTSRKSKKHSRRQATESPSGLRVALSRFFDVRNDY
jgi:hypothetical protein